jgi:hypothetical protein
VSSISVVTDLFFPVLSETEKAYHAAGWSSRPLHRLRLCSSEVCVLEQCGILRCVQGCSPFWYLFRCSEESARGGGRSGVDACCNFSLPSVFPVPVAPNDSALPYLIARNRRKVTACTKDAVYQRCCSTMLFILFNANQRFRGVSVFGSLCAGLSEPLEIISERGTYRIQSPGSFE